MVAIDATLPHAKRVLVQRRFATTMIAVPTAGVICAFAMVSHEGTISLVALALFGCFYFASVIGLEIGFHRYFSHRSFKCGPALRFILAFLGSIAGEGPVLFWAATHRRHHAVADTEDDPHGPLKPGLAGFIRAHMGWLFEPQTLEMGRICPDLIRDRTTMFAQRFYFLWVALGLLLPSAIGFMFHGARGAFDGFLWGGLVRIFIAHHATWSINSMCHLFGTRGHDTDDASRNLAPLALLTLGGSWHNNHHAFPRSAFNDFRWWQIDPSAWLIRLAAKASLVWDVQSPLSRPPRRSQHEPA